MNRRSLLRGQSSEREMASTGGRARGGEEEGSTDSIATRRGRREKKKSSASSALEKIRRGRETGHFEETEVEAPEQLFDYVTEDEYSKLVRERQSDGFILDDDGTYSEHGREIFEDEADVTSNDKNRAQGGKHGGGKGSKRVGRPAGGNIKALVMGMGGGAKKRKEGSKASIVGDELLADMLQQMESKPKLAASPSAQPRSSYSSFTTPQRKPLKFTPRLSSTPSSSSSRLLRPQPSPSSTLTKRVKREHTSPPPPPPPPSSSSTSPPPPLSPPPQPNWDDAADDWDEEMAEVDDAGYHDNHDPVTEEEEKPEVGFPVGETPPSFPPPQQLLLHLLLLLLFLLLNNSSFTSSSSSTTPPPSLPPPHSSSSSTSFSIVLERMFFIERPEAAVSVSGWETVREDMACSQETASQNVLDSPTDLPTEEIDGEEVLQFYWVDAYELSFHQPGTVYLFGKVWVPSSSSYLSCCVVVKNIQRCLYFLPREKTLGPSGMESDTPVTFEDIYTEFNTKYAVPHRIMKFISRRVTRRYAFDLPDIPQESEYLQISYSAEYPAPPTNATGRTFSRVFGTTTSSLEQLVLSRQLKGPCWLHIVQPRATSNPVSWCRLECMVGGPENVRVVPSQAPPPPLVTLSLSFTLYLNPKSHSNEVLCVGALVHSSVSLDKPPPKTPFEADFCSIRRPVDRNFPFGFEDLVKRKKFNVEVVPSERALLAFLLAKIHRIDPDIIVGHNLTVYQLAVLQHRLAACKVPHWSRISRLRRKDMPKGKWAGSQLCAGRPVCDVMISARELIRARSYDLAELSHSVLGKAHTALEPDDIPHGFSHAERLASLVVHTMDEALLSLQIMYELNVIPLAYQITHIAGNILSRTLSGGRAERNEYLLLHAFSTKDYICPDKLSSSKKQALSEAAEEEEGEGGNASVKGRRKPAYTGGLVLEPKKGFYDTFILLLDYNSLYPSIIQEYNICFTTVDHAHCSTDGDDYNQIQLPDPSLPPGVLPSQIRVLVERRRQVKQLMKNSVAGSEQHTQLDIRQKALKLTANSMYGCLGFTQSRFHAKPLAALVTGKGREILSHTKELAEKLGLDVIYGDTDSVMINSHTHSLTDAQAMAQKFKQEVNKLYRLLEIDVDGIFQSLLLLKKKKYAAKTVEVRDGHKVYGMELKGLDIVRRDWCQLAKTAGHKVLNSILSGKGLDEVIDEVHAILQQLTHDVAEDKIPLEDYVITKSLTRNPNEYPDKKSLPHVQVALRMQSRGRHVQAGDVIPYVMCQSDTQQSMSLSAYHPDELTSQAHLKLDRSYYLRHQLHAVVSRLCEPIDGLDSAQIATCLGLDPTGFRQSGRMEGGEGREGERDEDKFKDCALPTVVCPSCAKIVVVAGATISGSNGGLKCPECKINLPVGMVTNCLTLTIKNYVRQYYAGWMVCDDKACRHRNRCLSVGVGGVSCPTCHHGKLQEEVPASAVCTQLQFYLTQLFPNTPDGRYKKIRETVSSFLEWNAYSRVDLSRVFPVL